MGLGDARRKCIQVAVAVTLRYKGKISNTVVFRIGLSKRKLKRTYGILSIFIMDKILFCLYISSTFNLGGTFKLYGPDFGDYMVFLFIMHIKEGVKI